MKKLKLDLDALVVDSFEAGEEDEARGTVRAHLTWTDPQVCPRTQNWYCTGGDCTQYPKACPLVADE